MRYGQGWKSICVGVILLASIAQAQLKIAVIDSGLATLDDIKVCEKGHYDFVTHVPGVGIDIRDHGTNVAAILSEGSDTGYCLLIYRVFAKRGASGEDIALAIDKAIKAGAVAINMSLSGKGEYSLEEYASLWRAGRKGIKIFVAAGNNEQDLNKTCDVYPACYAGVNMTVVGSKGENKGNKGKVITQEESYCYGSFCGTSASTAIATKKYLHSLLTHK